VPGIGVDSYFRIAEESAWGTAETTNFYEVPVISGSVDLEIATIESEYIISGAARPDDSEGGRIVRGTIEFPLTYNLCDWFIQGVMGKWTKSTPSTGTNTRDHWGELITTLTSYTFEISRGDIPTDKVFVYTGMKVDEVNITVPDQGPGTLSATFIGETEDSANGGDDDSVTGLTLASTILEVGAHELQAGWDVGPGAADTYCIRNFNLRIARGLAERYCQGSKQTKEPLANDFATVDGSFDIEFDDRTVYDSFRAFTQETSGNLLYQSPTETETSHNYEMEFALNNIRYLGPSAPVFGDRGILVANCPFTGTGNGGTATDGTPDETSDRQPVAIRTRNLLDW
jgi:hypothetical protein